MNWKEYELAVTDYLKLQFPEAEVVHNARLFGKNSKVDRQIDTLIKCQIGELNLNIVVDSKFHKEKIDVTTVNEFIGLLDDVRAHKGFLVSKKGFTEAAINTVENNNRDVELILLDFETVKSGNSIIGIPYHATFGVIIIAPLGWILEPCPEAFKKKAILYPMGTDRESLLSCKADFMYVNFWFKDDKASSIKELNELQKNTVLKNLKNAEFQEESINNIFIRRNSVWNENGKIQDLVELTATVDYGPLLFSLIMITSVKTEVKNKNKLLHTIRQAIPVRFDRDPGDP